MRILSILGFPHYCITFWDGTDLLYSDVRQHQATSCELIIPQMMNQFIDLCGINSIETLATFDDPGPFTTMRAVKSFVFGIKAGLNVPIFMPSLFDVLPNAEKTAVYLGGERYILMGDKNVSFAPINYQILSTTDSSENDMLVLSELLANYVTQIAIKLRRV